MNRPRSVLRALLVIAAVLAWAVSSAVAQNQTPTVSPVLPPIDVPFRVSIEQAAFSLPTGLQSYVAATHQGRWLLVSGRTGGLHGFYSTNNNFQPESRTPRSSWSTPRRRAWRRGRWPIRGRASPRRRWIRLRS